MHDHLYVKSSSPIESKACYSACILVSDLLSQSFVKCMSYQQKCAHSTMNTHLIIVCSYLQENQPLKIMSFTKLQVCIGKVFGTP